MFISGFGCVYICITFEQYSQHSKEGVGWPVLQLQVFVSHFVDVESETCAPLSLPPTLCLSLPPSYL